jgi:hypothetical protein
MTIGIDIEQVLEEIGTAYSVLRANSGEFDAEYLDYEMNRQVTKPFIREHFLEVIFPYNTIVVGGDVVQFNVDNRKFLVMNITPENFENTCIGKEGVLYKCNVSGEVLRPSGEVWDTQTYHKTPAWETIKTNAFGVITEKLFGTDLAQDEPIGQIGIYANELYIPHSFGVQELDRYVAQSGEYWKIQSIETRKFDGVDICQLVEDTRPSH